MVVLSKFREDVPLDEYGGIQARRIGRFKGWVYFLLFTFGLQAVPPVPAFAAPLPRQSAPAPTNPQIPQRSEAFDPMVQKILTNSANPKNNFPSIPGGGLEKFQPTFIPSASATQVAQVVDPTSSATPAPPADTATETTAPKDDTPKPEPTRFPVPDYTPKPQEWNQTAPEDKGHGQSQGTGHSSSDHQQQGQGSSGGDPSICVPNQDHSSDGHDEHGNSGGHDHSKLGLVFANPNDIYPPFQYSRQTSPGGFYYQAAQTSTSGNYQSFSQDHTFIAANTFQNLAKEEFIYYDFYAPSGAATLNSNPRGAAATVEWHYLANAANSTSSLSSQYRLSVRVWDAKHNGTETFSKTEPLFLAQLKTRADGVLRNQGDWIVKVTRGGTTFSNVTVTVADEGGAVGINRKVNGAFQNATLDPGPTAYTNDEDVQYTSSTAIPAYSGNGTQTFQIKWDLVAPPNSHWNNTDRHSYWSLTSNYATNGTSYVVNTVVADSLFKHPRLYQTKTGSGSLSTLDLSYGEGLPTYGTYTLKVKAGDGPVNTTTINVRELDSACKLVTPGIYTEPGASVPFELSFNSYGFTPANLTWTLKLVNQSNGSIVRTYTGNITGNVANNATWVQLWDGTQDGGGNAPLGIAVNPVFSIGVVGPPGDPPYILNLHTNFSLAAEANARADFTIRILDQTGAPLLVLQQSHAEPYNLTYSSIPASYAADGNGNVTIYFSATTLDLGVFIGGGLLGESLTADGTTANVTNVLTGQIISFTESQSLPSVNPTQPHSSEFALTVTSGGKEVSTEDVIFDHIGIGTVSSPNPRSDYFRLFVASFAPGDQKISYDINAQSQNSQTVSVTYAPSDYCALCGPIQAFLQGLLNPSTIQASPIPIELSSASGRYRHYFTDLAIPTKGLPLTVSRAYTSDEQKTAPLYGWEWNYSDHLIVEPNSNQVYHQNEPNQDMDIFLPQGTGWVAGDLSNTDVLSQIDATHYLITTKSHLRRVYQAIKPSTTLPFTALLQSETDQNGNTNTNFWSADGTKLLKMQGPDPSQFITFYWSGNHPGPDKATDYAGRSVIYSYSPQEQEETECREGATDWLLSKVTQPGNKVYEFGYHQVLGERTYHLLTTTLNGVLQEKAVGLETQPGVLQEVTHLEGVTMSFVRDNSGPAPTTTITRNAPSGMPQNQAQVWTYVLDDTDRIVSGKDAAGRTANVTYDGNHNVLFAQDPLGRRISQTFNSRNDQLTNTDALGRTTTTTWDANDNPTSVTLPDGSVTIMGWDSNNRLVSVTDPLLHKNTLTYTSFGSVATATDNLNHTWIFQYNSLGFLSGKTAPAAAPGQPQAQWTYEVDNLGRTTASIDPLNRKTRFEFDVRDRLVKTTIPAVSAKHIQDNLDEGTVTATFDNNDLLLATKALDGLVTTYDYSPSQRLVAVHKPGTTKPTLLQYDAMEHVVGVTNSNSATTTYQYDVLNRAVGMVYPGGSSESYQFDNNSNLIAWNRGAYTVGYKYDTLDRLTNIDSPATNDSISLDYDQLDRVKSMADNSGATVYDFNPNYTLKSVTHPGNKTFTYNYDGGDRLTGQQDPEGLTTAYSYSNRNELNTITHDGKTVSFVHDLLGLTRIVHMPNGVDAKMDFSERNQLLYKEYDKGANPLITLKYGFNQVGQRIAGQQIDANGTEKRAYGYNNRRELIASSVDGPRGQHSGIQYALDQNDNITNNNGVGFTSNVADQLTKAGSTALGYNGAGQATTWGDKSLTFSYKDQIKAITGPGLNAQYLYDGNGQRVQKTVNGVVQKFLWNGGSIAKEYRGDGSVRADYQLGVGAKIEGNWQFYLSDIQGSTIGIADDQGKVIAQYSYSDYGVTTQTSGAKGLYQPFLYTHSELDAETGIYHNKARHYAPQFGKFLARDPIANSNLYSYCNGDPINFSDPSGLESYVFYTDGTFVTVSSGLGLLIAIRSAEQGSIAAIVTRGHGGTNVADATSANIDSGGFAYVGDRTVLQYKSPGGAIKSVGLDKLLQGKLAPGAQIILNNCSTASGDDNIAKAISKNTSATVRGVAGTLNESSKFGYYIDNPSIGSGFVYYKKGEVVGNGAQVSNDYTIFDQDSSSH